MADSHQVRPATTDDARAIQRVARESWHAAYDSLLGEAVVSSTVDAWFDPDRLVADDVRPDERPLFVADGADGLVGFAEAVPGDDEDVYHLYRIYVTPSAWGTGIGTSLLERVEAAARERGARRLRLSVLAENDDAVAFYEARGFERVGESYDEQFDARRFAYAKNI